MTSTVTEFVDVTGTASTITTAIDSLNLVSGDTLGYLQSGTRVRFFKSRP